MNRQSYLNCGPGRNSSNGCNGGEPSDVFQYMKDVSCVDSLFSISIICNELS